ncbi:MAG: transposase [Nitrososphaeria archaeon]
MNESNYYRELHKSKFPHKYKLDEVKRLIDWEVLRPILNGLFKDTLVGRPHVDVVVMAKMLVLKAWYSLSDERLEIQCKDRLTFQNFLNYPESIPDARTVWLFRDRFAQSGREKEFWDLFRSQLKKLDLKVEEGESKEAVFVKREREVVRADKDNAHLQDSTMLEADPGAPAAGDIIKRKELEAKGDKNGTQISMSYDEIKKSKERVDEANTRRSADGSWTMKRGKSYSGFKLHTEVRAKDSIIED